MTTHLIRFTDGIATDASGRQYRLVPVEPSPTMIAAGGISVVPEASAADIAIAIAAAKQVMMEGDTGTDTIDLVAATLSTMIPFYRTMLSAATVDLEGMAVRVPEPMLNDIGST